MGRSEDGGKARVSSRIQDLKMRCYKHLTDLKADEKGCGNCHQRLHACQKFSKPFLLSKEVFQTTAFFSDNFKWTFWQWSTGGSVLICAVGRRINILNLYLNTLLCIL